jgi:nicotinate phosphoribosyltransferase
MLRVTAPLPEAQVVETALMASMMFQTSVASRAARMVEAASGRPVVEFGARRAHGVEAGLLAARAAFLAGCDGTSFVDAGRRFGIPLAGTMAHSWVLAFGDEATAFGSYAGVFGDRAVLLLDTYDTLTAAKRVAASGLRPDAVRLDSGDIVSLSRAVREILDAAGLGATRIFATGDLDEWRIAEIVAAGAPVDAFGVGTALSTSSDAPALGGVYKLVEIERAGALTGIMKLSPGKHTFPGRKQVWRVVRDGAAVKDVIALADEAGPSGGRPLLTRVMKDGRREGPRQPIHELRAHCRAAVAELPHDLRRPGDSVPYSVQFSDALTTMIERLSTAGY